MTVAARDWALIALTGTTLVTLLVGALAGMPANEGLCYLALADDLPALIRGEPAESCVTSPARSRAKRGPDRSCPPRTLCSKPVVDE